MFAVPHKTSDRGNVDMAVMDRGSSNEALTNIIEMLNVNTSFSEVVLSILREALGYINMSHAALMQVDKNNQCIENVIEYSMDGSDLIIDDIQLDTFKLVGSIITVQLYDESPEDIKKIMDRMGIKRSVAMPVFINNSPSMYLAFFDKDGGADFNTYELECVSNPAQIIQCIAQKKATKNSLLSSYEVLREILSNIGFGIIVCNKDDGSIFFKNDIVDKSQEISRTIGQCLKKYINMSDDDKAGYKDTEHYDAESGSWFEVKFSELEWIDGSQAVVCSITDITQKKKNQQKIEYQAQNDFLTGLYNRRKCESDLRSILKSVKSNNEKGAVLFLDLDDFKHINDGLGHQYGDILLQQISVRLQAIPGLYKHCYRMGGDEFIVIITPGTFMKLDEIIKDILAMFNKPWYLMETEYYCTMSMGIAVFPDNADNVNDVIRKADLAMYDSKKSGKNKYCFYNGKDDESTIKRLDIENNMRQAIASQIQEFVVFYQPVMDLESRRVKSCEALVRWNSHVMGFMGPGEFIPLAEYLGLITAIGDYVLEEACKQCKIWNETIDENFSININLSVVQLLQKNITDNIKEIFARTGVNPANITFEITESFAINDMKRVMEIIEGLRSIGPKIALDDFGTGYSSLNYIKQLPLDLIKVDKTFIDDIIEDEYAQAFIKLIIGLSKTLGTKVIVEGVETAEQSDVLKNLGVNYIQGYLYGKPVPADDFERIHLR